ncbi:MAG: RHS repeat-associated core domain-containing protein [Terracidiphilus sp.]
MPPHSTGKERDAESGNDYFGARYYASSMGRFMSPDDGTGVRLTNPQSLNRYAYVFNNPLMLIDPTGHSTQTAQNGDVLCVFGKVA